MRRIAQFITVVTRMALYAAALVGTLMAAIVFFAVTMRYVLMAPIRFADEFVGLLFSAALFLSIPFLFANNLNIRVTLMVERMSATGARIANLVSNIGIVLFFLFLGYLSFDFTAFSYSIGAKSDIAQIPVTPWMALMPVSSFLTAFVVLLKTSFEPFGIVIGDDPGQGADPVHALPPGIDTGKRS